LLVDIRHDAITGSKRLPGGERGRLIGRQHMPPVRGRTPMQECTTSRLEGAGVCTKPRSSAEPVEQTGVGLVAVYEVERASHVAGGQRIDRGLDSVGTEGAPRTDWRQGPAIGRAFLTSEVTP
jgi:hypothetical protein